MHFTENRRALIDRTKPDCIDGFGNAPEINEKDWRPEDPDANFVRLRFAAFHHGVTVRTHVFDIPSVAVIVIVIWLGTVVVVTVKVADLAPAGTVTVAGTMTTLGSLLVRVT